MLSYWWANLINSVSQLAQWQVLTCAGAGGANAMCCSNVGLAPERLSKFKLTLGHGIVFLYSAKVY